VFFPKDEYSYLENLHEYEANPIPTHMTVNQPSLGISKNSHDSWGEMLPLSIPLMKSKVHHLQWKKFSCPVPSLYSAQAHHWLITLPRHTQVCSINPNTQCQGCQSCHGYYQGIYSTRAGIRYRLNYVHPLGAQLGSLLRKRRKNLALGSPSLPDDAECSGFVMLKFFHKIFTTNADVVQ